MRSAETPDHVQLERIARKVAPDSRLARAWQLKGGSSAHMTALELQRPDGRVKRLILRRPKQAVVRLNPDAAANEFRVLQITRSLGLPSQKPYLLDESGAILTNPYLVIDYVEGAADFSAAHASEVVRQMAEHLAAIHRVDPSAAGLTFLLDVGQSLLAPLRDSSAHAAPSSIEGQLIGVIDGLGSVPGPPRAAFLHGDFWPGNLLWHEGQLAAIIDWEDAALGDPLSDLAISRFDILFIFGRDAMLDFTRRYVEATSADLTRLPYWDLYAALRAAPHLGEWAPGFADVGRPDITDATIRAPHDWFVAQALAGMRKEWPGSAESDSGSRCR